jgi:hypothetical protein
MQVYGADFSGARNPSKGIYYTQGVLSASELCIERVVHCDDRLDLLAAIHFSRAPWGLDFPFSLPTEAFKQMNLKSWSDLLDITAKYKRNDFGAFVENSGTPSCELKCQGHSNCCRAVDGSINSFSPLKKTNPNMRMMTYAGLKLLFYLRILGSVVYPFDLFEQGVSRLYEVYPSHTWKQVGLPRSTDLGPFINLFSEKYSFKVKIENHPLRMENLDAADAVVACVTMAYALEWYGLEDDWSRQHDWISDLEWEQRHKEGLIVKIN